MRRLALLLSVVALVAVGGAVHASQASAHVIFTYASGTNGVGGNFNTTGYAARDFNRVYHEAGTSWSLYYCHPDTSCTTTFTGNVNPLVDTRTDTYGLAGCQNNDDDSFVTWTCQTTRPS